MSLGDAHILMFYGRPENVNLTHSVKFYTITFLKDSFGVPPRRVYSELSHTSLTCLITFEETSQGRPNYVLKWRLLNDGIETSQGRQF